MAKIPVLQKLTHMQDMWILSDRQGIILQASLICAIEKIIHIYYT